MLSTTACWRSSPTGSCSPTGDVFWPTRWCAPYSTESLPLNDSRVLLGTHKESMLRLWRKPELLQQCTDDVRAWLYTVARKQVIDDRRSARYAGELKTDSVPEQTSPDEIGPALVALRIEGPANR